MGILDMVESMAGQSGAGGQNAQVAGGLVQEMQSQPGGLGSLLSMFHQNGMGGAASQWANGQTQPADSQQIQQGMGGGMIDSIAQRTGLSPSVVKTGLAVAVPLMIHHLVQQGHVTQDGQQTGSTPDAGGMLQSVLGRML